MRSFRYSLWTLLLFAAIFAFIAAKNLSSLRTVVAAAPHKKIAFVQVVYGWPWSFYEHDGFVVLKGKDAEREAEILLELGQNSPLGHDLVTVKWWYIFFDSIVGLIGVGAPCILCEYILRKTARSRRQKTMVAGDYENTPVGQ